MHKTSLTLRTYVPPFRSIAGVQRACGWLFASAEEIDASLVHDLREKERGRMLQGQAEELHGDWQGE